MNKEGKKVYVVTGMAGEYEDTTTRVVAVYEKKEDAENWVENQKNWKSNSKKIAIDYETYYNLQEDFSSECWQKAYHYITDRFQQDDELSDARTHWMHYAKDINKVLCKKVQMLMDAEKKRTYTYVDSSRAIELMKKDKSFTSNDVDIVAEAFVEHENADNYYYEISDDDNFIKWLFESKGYSQEVAEASYVVNNHDDYSDYNTYYFIEEVNYYGTNE